MEGFYSNLEDGLFELAYRHSDSTYHGYCFNLMRELRFRRQTLMDTFTSRMNDGVDGWFADLPPEEGANELDSLALGLSRKCSAHFSGLLGKIIQRTEPLTAKPLDLASLPIGPYQVARHFVHACHLEEFDRDSIEAVQELFLRFVLDRLGAAYGQFNQLLSASEARSAIERQVASA